MHATALRPLVRLVAPLLVWSISGCASLDGGGAGAAAPPLDPGTGVLAVRAAGGGGAIDAGTREIARDFLHAFGQLAGRAPHETTVRFARDTLAHDPFVVALEREMRALGYGVRLLPATDAADDAVGHLRHEAADGGTVHTLVVGELRLRRAYGTSASGSPRPAGPLFVLGADASGIDTDRLPAPARRAAVANPPLNRFDLARTVVVDFD